jgi:glycosyltransferase involved in cell wall biosynthesis
VANTPTDFAEAVVELYESEELWTRLSENGIRKTRALYSADAARKKLQLLFSDEHLKSMAQSAAVEQTEIAIAARS